MPNRLFYNRFWIVVSLWFLGTGAGTFAQSNSPVFEAFADANDVLLNDFFEVTFTLRNGDGSEFKAPRFEGFKVVSGPNQSSRVTIVNGVSNREIAVIYRLQPTRVGQFTIGAASIKANGKTLQTRPIAIRVLEAPPAGASDDGAPVLLKAKISKLRTYAGQQLVVDYWLYHNVDVSGINLVDEPKYNGFFFKPVDQFDTRAVREFVNGRPYTARIIKRVALYPQQTGKQEITPLTLEVGIPDSDNKNRDFFGRPVTVRKVVTSEAFNVEVVPLPTPQPDDFSGITGEYTLQATVNRREISTDDALSLVLTLEGSGDLKRMQAPKLQLPDAFEAYEPKVLSEDYYALPQEVKGKKQFEYLLVPQRAGTFTLHPKVIVFNPAIGAYDSLLAAPIDIQVVQGSGKQQSIDDANSGDSAANQLHPFRTGIRAYQPASPMPNALLWSLWLLPFVVFGAIWWQQQQRLKQPAIDPQELRKQQARQMAEQRLQEAAEYLAKQDNRNFYQAIERAMLGYVGDKLQIPRANLTKHNVAEQLVVLQASEVQTRQWLDLIQTCEMALYGGVQQPGAQQQTYAQARDLLAGLEALS